VNVEIRELHTPDACAELDAMFRGIWATTSPVVAPELLVALAHSGGYVAAARVDGTLVGGSVGFLAVHDGQPALHSHVTGLRAEARGVGVGRALKVHQRDWARRRGLAWITWTFDPLVRRNAWFNLAVLGADAVAYLPNFYGTMTDGINDGDDSDRLLVAWDVERDLPGHPRDGAGAPSTATRIATPPDIVALRRTDPAAARRWRADVRTSLGGALGAGGIVAGFTAQGEYVIGSGDERPW
jgi:predicted GNAT superfamily acetyltransferase